MSEPAARVAVAESAAPVALGDTFALLKPRVMSLVVFTGAVGLIIAPGTIHPSASRHEDTPVAPSTTR